MKKDLLGLAHATGCATPIVLLQCGQNFMNTTCVNEVVNAVFQEGELLGGLL